VVDKCRLHSQLLAEGGSWISSTFQSLLRKMEGVCRCDAKRRRGDKTARTGCRLPSGSSHISEVPLQQILGSLSERKSSTKSVYRNSTAVEKTNPLETVAQVACSLDGFAGGTVAPMLH
jgi:hypothetical protein